MAILVNAVIVLIVVNVVIVVTGGKQSQLLALALGLGWSLTKKGMYFIVLKACSMYVGKNGIVLGM